MQICDENIVVEMHCEIEKDRRKRRFHLNALVEKLLLCVRVSFVIVRDMHERATKQRKINQ
jgi:hypothetical protein